MKTNERKAKIQNLRSRIQLSISTANQISLAKNMSERRKQLENIENKIKLKKVDEFRYQMQRQERYHNK